MVNLCQSRFSDLVTSGGFLWCTGIEDTFITAPAVTTGRTLDEYELTGHYEHWREDIDLMAECGATAARYGIPWHRLNPRPGEWDWSWADRPLERMLELGIAPIVDLVHYGLPPWIEGAFCHPDYPRYVADFAARVAERFKGRIHAYTPLNEPRITAWYCGRLGWWPPFRHSWRGFVDVMMGVCRGIVATVEALRQVDPEILCAHVDATDWYHTDDPLLADEAQHRQELVFLALDLVSGRVRAGHPLLPWLEAHGVTDRDLAWFAERAVALPLIGINLYPMFTNKLVARTPAGRSRITMPYASGQLVLELGRMYGQRYGAPLFISETASSGSVRRRQRWLDDSVAAVRQLRAEATPVLGYTWWPLFALVTWAYRQGRHPAAYYYRQMGLWNLDPAARRVRTSLVDAYRALANGGLAAVGALSVAASSPALVGEP